jgi:hypothetical protein
MRGDAHQVGGNEMTAVKPDIQAPGLESAALRPKGFAFGPVQVRKGVHAAPASAPLGALASFTGTFQGTGFNTIFRPQNAGSLAPLTPPVPGDNVLELNLTSEILSFSPSLGDVPNRGMVQKDIALNGLPYLQTISDVTDPDNPVGIHVEPGLWMAVPATQDPDEGITYVRMASIPHGTTMVAQGTSSGPVAGPPNIPAVSITPGPRFDSQTAANQHTARIPQDLSSFMAAGTITQQILDDPNTVLRNAIASQKIVSTTAISVSTSPSAPLFGGGTDNIAFLLGDGGATHPNAQTVSVSATFWIETVEHTILVPVLLDHGPGPLVLTPQQHAPGVPTPTFTGHPPLPLPHPRTITVHSTQIQYSQTVVLNFNGLRWPHVSVATLVPHAPIPIPGSAW